MNFTLSTKPLVDALDLGVIQSNISKYYQKSCLAQLTASNNELKINLEATNIVTEIILSGSGDSESSVSTFVDCQLFKSLISTLGTAVITIEFTDGGIIIHSGSSKFQIPKVIESDEMSLNTPSPIPFGTVATKVDKTAWKFIKDYQMYAIATSFVHRVYTYIWMGESGDVLVGDFDNSLFTYSRNNKLNKTCLISETIVNLFNNLPEGADIAPIGDNYRIDFKTDTLSYATEFSLGYESDEDKGSYNSDLILDMVNASGDNFAKVPVAPLIKFLGQAELLGKGSESTIQLSLANSELVLKDSNINCKLKVESNTREFSADFSTSILKSVLSNVDDDNVKLFCFEQDGDVAGIIIATNNMSTVLGAIEE